MTSLNLISRLSWITVLAVVVLTCLPFAPAQRSSTAEACWTHLRIECFDSTRTAWPWCLPSGTGRCWRISPNPPQLTWGVQDRFYSVRISSLCGNDDDQSLWIIGEPGSEDPEFDDYPANRNTFVTYGPIVTTGMQEARVQFSFLMYNNLDFQDTLCWGADSVFALGTTHIWVDTVFAGQTDEGWRTVTMDLKDLYRNNATRDSVSALNRPAVYIFWWFRSDGDAIRDVGAFIDDVIISVDNGAIDMASGGMDVREPDGVTIPTRIEAGESIRARMTWTTCDGGVLLYPSFRARLLLDSDIVFDSIMTNVAPGQTFSWMTDPIEMTVTGEREFQFVVDPLGEATESNENNNTTSYPFTVHAPNVPPSFEWITPSEDTLGSEGVVTLRWQLFDPDDEATVTLHIDNDTSGCVGPIVPGTLNRPETEGPDQVNWTTTGIPVGQIRWLFAEYSDLLHYGCEYSPFPVLILQPNDAGEPQFLPVTFDLNQNYPNPFNPETQIKFSITRGGPTTLKVFDITGREVTTLINNELSPGFYETNFNAGINHPSGVYIYRLDAPEGSISKKMILMK